MFDLQKLVPLERSYVLALLKQQFPDHNIGNTFPGISWEALKTPDPAIIYIDDDGLILRDPQEWLHLFDKKKTHIVLLDAIYQQLKSHGIPVVLCPFWNLLEDSISTHLVNEADLFQMPKTGQKFYFCLNSNHTEARELVVNLLDQQHLFNFGMISARWSTDTRFFRDSFKAYDQINSGFERHCGQYKSVGITANFANAIDISAKYYPPIQISVETSINNYHPTEKSIQGFMMHRIPIILAEPGRIAYLSNEGFDMFYDIIDHSYDRISDPNLRIESAIVKNLQILSNPLEITESIQKRLRNNYNHFTSTWMFAKIESLLSMIKQINSR